MAPDMLGLGGVQVQCESTSEFVSYVLGDIIQSLTREFCSTCLLVFFDICIHSFLCSWALWSRYAILQLGYRRGFLSPHDILIPAPSSIVTLPPRTRPFPDTQSPLTTECHS
jgi:hypothetical protein